MVVCENAIRSVVSEILRITENQDNIPSVFSARTDNLVDLNFKRKIQIPGIFHKFLQFTSTI